MGKNEKAAALDKNVAVGEKKLPSRRAPLTTQLITTPHSKDIKV